MDRNYFETRYVMFRYLNAANWNAVYVVLSEI